MSSELTFWFRDDVTNLLRGLTAAQLTAEAWTASPDLAAYRAGYLAAIGATALSFGIRPQDVGARFEQPEAHGPI
jgi:hypothetical protein